MSAGKPVCGIIGAGRAGSALARAMYRAGYRFAWVSSCTAEDAQRLAAVLGNTRYGASPPLNVSAEMLIVAVPDSAIGDALHDAIDAGCVPPGAVVFHLSGALDECCLDAAKSAGATVMAFHPAQTFTPETDPGAAFRGIWFDMEGDTEACAAGERIAHDLGARAVRFDHPQRTAAHLAMSMASNYTVALVYLARELMERYGIPADTAAGMLGPLVASTAENISRHGALAALTGPVSRGDAAVVRDHLELLRGEPERVQAVYRLLALEALDIARARGSVDAAAAGEIERLLADIENG